MNYQEYEKLYQSACIALRKSGAKPFEVEAIAVNALSKYFQYYKRRRLEVEFPKALINKIAIREFVSERKRKKKRAVMEKEYSANTSATEGSTEFDIEATERARLFESLIERFAARSATRDITIACIKRIHAGEVTTEIDESLGLPKGKARACWSSFLRFVRSVRHEIDN